MKRLLAGRRGLSCSAANWLALCSPSWNRFAGNGLLDHVKTSVGLACAGSYGVR